MSDPIHLITIYLYVSAASFSPNRTRRGACRWLGRDGTKLSPLRAVRGSSTGRTTTSEHQCVSTCSACDLRFSSETTEMPHCSCAPQLEYRDGKACRRQRPRGTSSDGASGGGAGESEPQSDCRSKCVGACRQKRAEQQQRRGVAKGRADGAETQGSRDSRLCAQVGALGRLHASQRHRCASAPTQPGLAGRDCMPDMPARPAGATCCYGRICVRVIGSIEQS